MGFALGPERRSGGLKTAEIGNRDFHSSDNSILKLNSTPLKTIPLSFFNLNKVSVFILLR